MRRDQISIQLYTLRDLLSKDVDGTLAQVAAAGYEYVEFAGFYGKTANEIRSLLDKHGLKTSSAHIPLTDFQTRLDGVVDNLVTLGAGWGIVPWVAPDDRSEEGLKAIAAQFDGFGSKLQEAGIKFGYHNHDFEFSTTSADGTTVFDQMIAVTTPGLVSFELDAFWAAVGGVDPAGVIRANPDRIGLVHLKDGKTGEIERGKDVPFGEGDLDWDGILAASRDAGVAWYVTEQDTPNADDPVADVTTAYRNAAKAAL
ncbi:MAG TPA: sugar phosphate isomerase/epimerase [Thermomicrobiales bacterium]|nr:sugar phosphate isomerase/epimerase [Thermomicrobiales bacterium]